jgi:hypothetical protein
MPFCRFGGVRLKMSSILLRKPIRAQTGNATVRATVSDPILRVLASPLLVIALLGSAVQSRRTFPNLGTESRRMA